MRRGARAPRWCGLPLLRFLGGLLLMAAQFGDPRDPAGVDAGHQPIGLFPLVVPAPVTRSRRPANRPCRHPAAAGSGPGCRGGDPSAFAIPGRAGCGSRFRARPCPRKGLPAALGPLSKPLGRVRAPLWSRTKSRSARSRSQRFCSAATRELRLLRMLLDPPGTSAMSAPR